MNNPQHKHSPPGKQAGLAASTLGAILLVLAAPSVSAQAQPDQSYLEVAGAKVPVSKAPDASGDRNALLNGDVSSAAPDRLTHQGNVNQQSNVPAPGKPGTRPQSPSAGNPPVAPQAIAQAQPTASTPPSSQPGVQFPSSPSAQQVSQVAPLPPPKIDIPKEAINRAMPANSEQLRQIVEEFFVRQGAASTPPRPGVKSRASQYVVDLSPGATPPVIRVAKGMGSTVNFVDSAGNPWPITFANNFYAEAASVTQMAPHVLSVAANSPHLSGSVGVMLNGLTTPVNFIVTPGQEESDYRVDLHIPGLSPDAPPITGGARTSRPGIGGDELMGYMYGATPEGSTRLDVKIPGPAQATTRAWQSPKGRLILRTSAQIQSPGWYQRLPALDGTAVYEMPPTPVVRVSVDGSTQTMTIKGLLPSSPGASEKGQGGLTVK